MLIKWYGHSCFLITAASGARILTDPYDPSVGYPMHKIECDAVSVSHMHFDHNYFDMCAGDPVRITGPGEHEAGGVSIRGVETAHDEVGGAKRGKNTVFIFELEDMRVMHAGDIGAMPDADTLAAIGPVDVLLVPVGGFYTIDGAGARELARLLGPKVTIPMHYKTSATGEDTRLSDLEPFLSGLKGYALHRLRQSEAALSRASLGTNRVITLDYARE